MRQFLTALHTVVDTAQDYLHEEASLGKPVELRKRDLEIVNKYLAALEEFHRRTQP